MDDGKYHIIYSHIRSEVRGLVMALVPQGTGVRVPGSTGEAESDVSDMR